MFCSIVEHLLLHIVLEIQKRENTILLILFRNIIRFDRHYDTGIGPLGVARRIGHAVEHRIAVLGGRRHKNSARAHAEREHSPVVNLFHE